MKMLMTYHFSLKGGILILLLWANNSVIFHRWHYVTGALQELHIWQLKGRHIRHGHGPLPRTLSYIYVGENTVSKGCELFIPRNLRTKRSLQI